MQRRPAFVVLFVLSFPRGCRSPWYWLLIFICFFYDDWWECWKSTRRRLIFCHFIFLFSFPLLTPLLFELQWSWVPAIHVRLARIVVDKTMCQVRRDNCSTLKLPNRAMFDSNPWCAFVWMGAKALRHLQVHPWQTIDPPHRPCPARPLHPHAILRQWFPR